ncbi:IS4 transposase [Halorientalis persicus]|uniref:IS4 transposase n=1 Tax=Halorientalis persicus TaxID=1367881 RepID=A0A1H8WK37_9EURY|nr:transposase [Halorientalis persicus]SEP27972.1 IS4 transposase [Halorientalis persicus]
MTDPSREALTPPIHLAYDTPQVSWYGDENERWTSGVLPTDNGASAWEFGVLSIVDSDMSYVLGALPLQNRSKIGAYLNRFLRRAIMTYNLDIGRVYMDSQLYTEEAVSALRQNNVDFLIQGKDDGGIEELLDEAEAGEIATREDVRFGDRDFSRPPNAFAWPVPSEKTGADDRDRPHEAFITDIDVEERDLEGLGQQFRKRWGIETSIREIKDRYHAKCNHSDHRLRAYYFIIATVLYNLSQYVDNRLEERLMADDVSWGGQEFLHAVRRVDPNEVPDWGGTFKATDDHDWTQFW